MPAKRLMLDILACNKQSKAKTGDIDPAAVAILIDRALSDPRRQLLLTQLGEYLAIAAEGSALSPESWKPLEHFPHLASF